MKYLSLAIAIVVLLTACKKDEEPQPNAPSFTVTAGLGFNDFNDIIITPDGHAIIWSTVSNSLHVAKVATTGAVAWNNSFTAAGNCSQAVTDNAGNIYFCGYEYIDSYAYAKVVKIDSQGNQVWAKIYGDSARFTRASAIAVATDGNLK